MIVKRVDPDLGPGSEKWGTW